MRIDVKLRFNIPQESQGPAYQPPSTPSSTIMRCPAFETIEARVLAFICFPKLLFPNEGDLEGWKSWRNSKFSKFLFPPLIWKARVTLHKKFSAFRFSSFLPFFWFALRGVRLTHWTLLMESYNEAQRRKLAKLFLYNHSLLRSVIK